MSTPQALSADIKRHGWRSGSAAPEALLPTVAAALEMVGRGDLVPRLHAGNARAFVVSHTCDLMVEDFEAEPSVEWIVADRRETVDRGNDRIQSTRMLDVAAADGVPFRFHTRNRLFTRRDVLAMHAPHASGSIDIDTAVRLVQRWLSRRYTAQTADRRAAHDSSSHRSSAR